MINYNILFAEYDRYIDIHDKNIITNNIKIDYIEYNKDEQRLHLWQGDPHTENCKEYIPTDRFEIENIVLTALE